MESIIAEKDIVFPLVSYNITVPYSKETLKNFIKHFMDLNQHDNMEIQNWSQIKENRFTIVFIRWR